MLKFPSSFFICMIVLSLTLHAQSARIFLDGVFSDWATILPLHSDPIGDPQGGDIDFQRLWAANDVNYLFIRIEVGYDVDPFAVLEPARKPILYNFSKQF